MGIRDRLKRRLGREPPSKAPVRVEKRAPDRGPIRARIDFAEERERASDPPPASQPAPGDPSEPTSAVPREQSPIQHAIQVTNPENGEVIAFSAAPGETVLDAAERAGLELPYSCRAGGCLSCSAKRTSGEVSLDEQFVLDEEHLAADFVLLCGTRVESPCTFVSHQQEAID